MIRWRPPPTTTTTVVPTNDAVNNNNTNNTKISSSRQRRRRPSLHLRLARRLRCCYPQLRWVLLGIATTTVVVVMMILITGRWKYHHHLLLLHENDHGHSTTEIMSSSSASSHHGVRRAVRHTTTSAMNTTTTTTGTSGRINMKEYIQQQNPLRRPIDYQYFTVRINTWERIEQLQLSIQHHLSCPSVLQIQVVWCLDQATPIPEWLVTLEHTLEPITVSMVDATNNDNKQNVVSYPRLVIERHVVNSLNERFRPLQPVPTAAVLSIDDDVIRPCLALDHTFTIWLRNPDRQVGFDARSHEVVQHHQHHHENPRNHDASTTPTTTTTTTTQWKYSYMSVTEKTNLYSLTLTRYSFFHQHYMTLYMNDMPSIIRTTVDQNFNCEDLAMSLLISACQFPQPKVPLLAQMWAVKSQIKLYVAQKISGTKNHKQIRDDCVQHFSQVLHLQGDDKADAVPGRRHGPLFHTVPLYLGTFFDYGDIPENWNDPPGFRTEWSESIQTAVTTVERWQQQQQQQPSSSLSDVAWKNEWKRYREEALRPIYEAGYIEKTMPWERKFSIHSERRQR